VNLNLALFERLFDTEAVYLLYLLNIAAQLNKRELPVLGLVDVIVTNLNGGHTEAQVVEKA
jgi:hypothetical protein